MTGELPKAVESDEEELESYPHENRADSDLGQAYEALGQYEKAVEWQPELAAPPAQVSSYENLASSFFALQRFDEARQLLHDGPPKKWITTCTTATSTHLHFCNQIPPRWRRN